MPGYFEKIMGIVYRKHKDSRGFIHGGHPGEEALACFLEDKLAPEDRLFIERHLVSCPVCSEYVGVRLKMPAALPREVPGDLLEKTKGLVIKEYGEELFDIFLKLKGKVVEIIKTSGDVLVGQELIPAPVLRSRQINNLKDEAVILKDFQTISIEARFKNNSARNFDLTVSVKDKQSHKLIRGLRVTLLKGDLELESYASEGTSVIFRGILPGVYAVEITKKGEKVAVVEIKVEA